LQILIAKKEKSNMFEVCNTHDFAPGMDQQAYMEYVKRAVGAVLQAPGLVELRSQRNVLGVPRLRVTTVWQSLSDWAAFSQSATWQAIEAEQVQFLTNTHTEIWGPSPVLPEPIRPSH
jgi:heme-degrading monooxygenase HmoA